jgi:hypothetical protein
LLLRDAVVALTLDPQLTQDLTFLLSAAAVSARPGRPAAAAGRRWRRCGCCRLSRCCRRPRLLRLHQEGVHLR